MNIGMGILVSLMLWFVEMPSPIMWGGLVAILNYVPYFGPIVGAGLRPQVMIDVTSGTFANARIALFRGTLDSAGYAAAGNRCLKYLS